MKEDLLKNIESSARELRTAKAAQAEKSKEIESQVQAIRSLEESMTLAHKHNCVLGRQLNELERSVAEASSRYNFFTAEAVNHPY